uniref:Uncharacterized protein n=1 Tax=Lactuca sativa TaxID=4236 RepID=A0A9R1VBI8_LACSA|nr:hypothetical protein LSAT_V11C500265100 [Lactuca sativa]
MLFYFVNQLFWSEVLTAQCITRKLNYRDFEGVVVAIDGNKLTIPIAFGLTMENNLYCCTWFLTRLTKALRLGRDVSFITNMGSSCIEHVFPDSYQGILPKYMRTRGVSSGTLQSWLWMTSNSYIVSGFEENFRWLNIDAREVLANIGNAKWARANFPNICWNAVNIDIP